MESTEPELQKFLTAFDDHVGDPSNADGKTLREQFAASAIAESHMVGLSHVADRIELLLQLWPREQNLLVGPIDKQNPKIPHYETVHQQRIATYESLKLLVQTVRVAKQQHQNSSIKPAPAGSVGPNASSSEIFQPADRQILSDLTKAMAALPESIATLSKPPAGEQSRDTPVRHKRKRARRRASGGRHRGTKDTTRRRNAKPLTPLQRLTFEIIKNQRRKEPISGKEIVAALQKQHGRSTCESTLTTHIIPFLKPLGIKSLPKRGYWFEPRPKR